MFQTKLLIDGDLVAGEGTEEPVVDPATGRTIAHVREASAHQIAQAVEAAGAAFRTWGQTTPQERSLLLLRLADRLEQDGAAYADVESLNCGKPRARVLPDELPAIVDCFRFFAGAARVLGGSAADEYLAGHTSMIRRDPIGVVAQITPWNQHFTLVNEMPHGGLKTSGYGKDMSVYGLEDYTVVRHVMVNFG